MFEVGDILVPVSSVDSYAYRLEVIEINRTDSQLTALIRAARYSDLVGQKYTIPLDTVDWQQETVGGTTAAYSAESEPECYCDIKALLSFGHDHHCRYMRSRK
jgi:hypothetical protein